MSSIKSPLHLDYKNEFDILIKKINSKESLFDSEFENEEKLIKKSILEFKENFKEEYITSLNKNNVLKLSRKFIMGILSISFFNIGIYNLFYKILNKKNKHKIKGIFSYFKEENYNDEIVEYILKVTPKKIEKKNENKIIKHKLYYNKSRYCGDEVKKSDAKLIQDLSAKDCYLSCFSDKYLGGGVMNNGFAQEEHMFIEFAELFVLILIHPKLEYDQSIEVRNCKRNCILTGRLQYTKFLKNIDEKIVTNILLFDSFDFRKRKNETEKELIQKQYEKLLSAFSNIENKKIVGGNWGCGVFKWSPVSSFLLQIMVCNILGIELHYMTMNKKSLKDIHKLLNYKNNENILKKLEENNTTLTYENVKFD